MQYKSINFIYSMAINKQDLQLLVSSDTGDEGWSLSINMGGNRSTQRKRIVRPHPLTHNYTADIQLDI